MEEITRLKGRCEKLCRSWTHRERVKQELWAKRRERTEHKVRPRVSKVEERDQARRSHGHGESPGGTFREAGGHMGQRTSQEAGGHTGQRTSREAGGNTGQREHPKHSRRRHPLLTQQSSVEQPTSHRNDGSQRQWGGACNQPLWKRGSREVPSRNADEARTL